MEPILKIPFKQKRTHKSMLRKRSKREKVSQVLSNEEKGKIVYALAGNVLWNGDLSLSRRKKLERRLGKIL